MLHAPDKHGRTMSWADVWGELGPRWTSKSPSAAKGSVVVMDVMEGTADGTLDDEATNSSRVLVAMDDGGFNSIDDGVDHHIHGT